MIDTLKQLIIDGGKLTVEEAVSLAHHPDLDALAAAADDIRRHFTGNRIDTCSIVNARSGRCTENCKWCAQSKYHTTGIDEYDFVEEDEVMRSALHNDSKGVHRWSLVTSGRKVSKRDLTRFCDYFRKVGSCTKLFMCASMGLLNEEELTMLRDAGVRRYHCNLETSASFFPHLCTTHTSDDKKRTIRAAQRAGLGVCSGGIIGMGETMEQRIEMAFELAELGVDSVPMNILNPIPGTALEHQPLISDDDIRRTAAIYRFILPRAEIRFAGGRMRLSEELTRQLLLGGINGALVGDMLTTIGNSIDDDYRLFDSLNLTH